MAHSKRQNKWIETIPEKAQTSNLLDKYFKMIVLMSKELKKNTDKELKETRKTMYGQNEKINKVTEIIKMDQTEILKLKTENLNEEFTRGFDRRFEQAEQRISEFEDTTMEIIEFKEQKAKRMKRSKEN